MKLTEAIDHFFVIVIHNFIKGFLWFVLRCFYFTKIIDSKNIPSKGGFIVAANHSSFFDPPLIGISTWRRMYHFMARDTLFQGWDFLHYLGAIPIKRATVDRNAWDKVITTVQEGHIVGLFPEGTRSTDGEIHEGKAGTGMLVYKSKCKVIPAYIAGGFQAWKKSSLFPTPFKKLEVIYGEPLSFDAQFLKTDNKETYIEITGIIMAAIKRLKEKQISMHLKVRK
ncbi:MAG: lysophospholipid acyltransferase family protein [bacterium]